MALRIEFMKNLYSFLCNPLRFQSTLFKNNRNFPIETFRQSSSESEGETGEKSKKPFRHNYHEEVEAGVNNQILAEFNASMVYLSMYAYYGNTRTSMPGCQSFFKKMYKEELEHAMHFIDYQLMRGADVRLFPITTPENPNWMDITVALGVALELEKRVKEKLECLYFCAEKHRDLQLMDIISTTFIKEQNESICELGRIFTRAKRVVDTGGVGRHIFDKELYAYVTGKYPETDAPRFYI